MRSSQAVPEREREELFADAMREKERKEKEARRLEKQRKSAALRAVLEDLGIKVGCRATAVSLRGGRGWVAVMAAPPSCPVESGATQATVVLSLAQCRYVCKAAHAPTAPIS